MASLAEVVQDIADRIVADDWFKSESPEGSQSYYVIGAGAYRDDVESGCKYTICFVGPGPNIGPLAEHVVRSQVAGSRPGDYLRRERKRLERAGASAAAIDRIVDGDFDQLGALFPKSMPVNQRVDLLGPFLEALRVSVGTVSLDQEEAQEVAAAREKLCLREVARKYSKIVDKWEQLDPLPFDDPALEEASKAYLYGFYRSSVVLSASVLESHLKRVAPSDKTRQYPDLVGDAAAVLGMNSAWVEQAKAVFRFRNRVVHDSYPPTHDEAGEVVSNTRDLLTRLLSADATA
jgi:hypothetical protein